MVFSYLKIRSQKNKYGYFFYKKHHYQYNVNMSGLTHPNHREKKHYIFLGILPPIKYIFIFNQLHKKRGARNTNSCSLVIII